MEQPANSNLFDIQIDQQILIYLNETARWTRFLSILGFIFCGLIALASITLGSYFSGLMANAYGGASVLGGAFFTVIYLLCALFLFFPTLFLYRFSLKIRKAVSSNDQVQMTDAFKNLKSYFKFHGIVAIVVLSFYALVIVAALIGVMVGSRH